ncbi:A/G-specific adenine glycosylase [Candidatus Uhrbacteria bacterium]|nr:A/G-specific adenine glycosylase [Candidatus Uhrbacteria bacterium]
MTSASRLLKWYDRHGRALPWRRTRDPYRILVSEIMLQQTQVERVKNFYKGWLKLFPTWKRLARATNEDVIRAWAGLGYNRRALILRDIAREVVTRGVPTTETGWFTLKGIGPYTAAAISAFAQKRRTLPIDTNIRRVLGRLLLGKPFPTMMYDKLIRRAAESFLPKHGRHYDIPQAVFDLATSICTKTPQCAICPLRDDCKAAKLFLNGSTKTPKRTTKKTNERHHRDKPFPDRIYRGRILRLVREWGQVRNREFGPLIDPTFDQKLDQMWINAMVDRLVNDGLLSRKRNKITLPTS